MNSVIQAQFQILHIGDLFSIKFENFFFVIKHNFSNKGESTLHKSCKLGLTPEKQQLFSIYHQPNMTNVIW